MSNVLGVSSTQEIRTICRSNAEELDRLLQSSDFSQEEMDTPAHVEYEGMEEQDPFVEF